MQAKIEQHSDFDENREDNLSEIQKVKKLVDQHTEQLQDMLELIDCRGGRGWPKTTNLKKGSKDDEANEAAERLALTFRKLIRRSEAVSTSCKDGISMLSNDAVVREAQKGMKQAEGLAKVTFIAFAFVPVSFTTSFFGMNFPELDPGRVHIWMWFALSGPIMLLSILVWSLDAKTFKAACRRIVSCFHPKQGSVEAETIDDK
jgi:hypothetical protein